MFEVEKQIEEDKSIKPTQISELSRETIQKSPGSISTGVRKAGRIFSRAINKVKESMEK